jgi:chromosome segregation ATPase
MSRLDLAKTRFEEALVALENTAIPLSQARNSALQTVSRLAELTSERESLQARVAELEDEIESLSGLTEEVETRLDGAIGEIRAALGR